MRCEKCNQPKASKHMKLNKYRLLKMLMKKSTAEFLKRKVSYSNSCLDKNWLCDNCALEINTLEAI